MVTLHHLATEHLVSGVSIERSEDGRFIAFKVENGAPRTLRAWAEAVRRMLLSLSAHEHYLFLHDLHHSGPSAFGAQMQQGFEELYRLRPDVSRSVAMVLPSGFAADVARLSIAMCELTTRLDYPIHWKVFASRKEAISWLTQTMP